MRDCILVTLLKMQPHPVARHHQPLSRKWPHPNPQLFFLREACKWFQNICRMHWESWGKRCFHSKSCNRWPVQQFLMDKKQGWMLSLKTKSTMRKNRKIYLDGNPRRKSNWRKNQRKTKTKKTRFFLQTLVHFYWHEVNANQLFFHYFCITSHYN